MAPARLQGTSVNLQGTSVNLGWHVDLPPSVNASDADADSSDFPFWEYDFPRDIWRVRPASQVAVKVAAFVPVILLGLLGNGAVLILVYRRRAMRTPVNLLLASMAVSDLFVASVLPSLTMVEDFFQNWVLGSAMCKLEGFFMLLLTLAGALTLVAVSLLRLVSIAAPGSAVQARFSAAGAVRLAAAIWILSALLASPLLRWRHYRERQWRDFLEQYCTEDQQRLGVYWLTVGAVLVWLPLLAILSSYAVMFARLEVAARRATRRGSGAPAAARGRDRVAVMLCAASAVYLACWTPFAAVIIKRYSLPDEAGAVTQRFQALWYAAHYLMYANAAFNPIVYWSTNETFRRGFRETFVVRGRRAAAAAEGEGTRKSVKVPVSTVMTRLSPEKTGVVTQMVPEKTGVMTQLAPEKTGKDLTSGGETPAATEKAGGGGERYLSPLEERRDGETREARQAEEADQRAVLQAEEADQRAVRQAGQAADQADEGHAEQNTEVDLRARSVMRF